MRSPSWRAVADTLAYRMANHAFCDAHPEAAPGDHCPFCADRAAYRLWQRKAGAAAGLEVPDAG